MSGSVRAIGFFGTAVATGSAALVALHGLIGSYEARIAEQGRPEDSVMVIVAARDLYPGLPIEEEDLYAIQIAPRFLPDGVFLSPEHVVGRIPRERVLANDLVRGERLADPESGVGLETVIPRGLRAISIDIADGPALSGFLRPSSYVDVLVTVTPEGKREPVTKTLLQAVFVLGVDSRMRTESADDAKGKRGAHRPSVTLLATADQAEQIAHADSVGEITLSLRPDVDVAVVANLFGVTVGDLSGLTKELKPKHKVVRRQQEVRCGAVAIIHGADKRTQAVDEAGLPCTPVSAEP